MSTDGCSPEEPQVAGGLRFVAGRIDEGAGAELVEALLADLRRRYHQEDADEPQADELAPPSGTFLLAVLAGDTVGCGGLRFHEPGVGELKRMYVEPTARRRGVARALLAELERAAIAIGYTRLVLETGMRQPEAIALYEGAGYAAIEPYGYYRWSPMSRCFAKDLEQSPRDQGTRS
jgi:GNAT superfamily N-acetyltransferase